ncbi:aminoglycoside phosphotransferase [Chitinispirillum alkaliphilum]|nr:aminoglycoside phosphotransferase [Chitinispirillum alkaliphilum]
MELTPVQIDFLKSTIENFNTKDWNVELAGQAASQRYFVRLSKDDRSCILVVWDSADEDWARFLEIGKELKDGARFLPSIYNSDENCGLILEEDLGSMTLKRFCSDNAGNKEKIIHMYKQVLDALHQWNSLDISEGKIVKSREMDFDTFLWETDYFAHHCVREYCGCGQLLGPKWDQQRRNLALEAKSLKQCLIHRDFQSENILILNNHIRFVDYQGARLGPEEYDLASLLFDPYISELDTSVSKQLFEYYKDRYSLNSMTQRAFWICCAQRLMQALGAYGNLTVHKNKTHYQRFIPVALERLEWVLGFLPDCSELSMVVSECRLRSNSLREVSM